MSMSQEEINADLFDEVQRLKKENRELKEKASHPVYTGVCKEKFGNIGISIPTPSGREVSVAFFQPPMDKMFILTEGKKYSVSIAEID